MTHSERIDTILYPALEDAVREVHVNDRGSICPNWPNGGVTFAGIKHVVVYVIREVFAPAVNNPKRLQPVEGAWKVDYIGPDPYQRAAVEAALLRHLDGPWNAPTRRPRA